MGQAIKDKIYGAHVMFPKISGKVIFSYSEMKIKTRYPDMIELEHYYFTSKHYSTRYFDKSMLEKEYEISAELTVFYSEDKQACIDWLTKKRDTLLESYKYDYERLLQSEIKEAEEE